MKKLFNMLLLSALLSTSLMAEINWVRITADFLGSKATSMIIKKAGLGSAEAMIVATLVEEIVTEENINLVVITAEKKGKAYRTDISDEPEYLGNIPMMDAIREYRDY